MRRRNLLVGGVALMAVTGTAAGKSQARFAPAQPDDARFMQLAIDEAAAAGVGFAAVIVKDGEVLARGANRTGPDRDPTAHGEMVSIRKALAAQGPDRLEGATVYTTGEPCCMCMGAIVWCKFARVVCAASLADIAAHFDQIQLSAEDVADKSPFVTVDVTSGVLRESAVSLLK